LSLLPTTREFLALVEQETGFPVKLLEDPNLPVLAQIRIARGAVPAHFLTYRPARDDTLDYAICYQCGFVLRLFETPPEERFDFIGTPAGQEQVRAGMLGPGGTLAGRGLGGPDAERVAGMVYDGLMTHLRSIPVGMRVADWIHANYPALHASQRATALKELAEARGSLQPEVRDMTPAPVYRATVAIDAAYAGFWAEMYAMRELAAPYRFSGYEADGRRLLEIWREVPADAVHDRELVDRWAAHLGLTGWHRWAPYRAPD
jgi:hypothetical protein